MGSAVQPGFESGAASGGRARGATGGETGRETGGETAVGLAEESLPGPATVRGAQAEWEDEDEWEDEAEWEGREFGGGGLLPPVAAHDADLRSAALSPPTALGGTALRAATRRPLGAPGPWGARAALESASRRAALTRTVLDRAPPEAQGGGRAVAARRTRAERARGVRTPGVRVQRRVALTRTVWTAPARAPRVAGTRARATARATSGATLRAAERGEPPAAAVGTPLTGQARRRPTVPGRGRAGPGGVGCCGGAGRRRRSWSAC